MSLKFICLNNHKLRKIWRGTDLSFQIWPEEFDKFWPEHLKVSKIFFLIGFFWTNYMLFQVKSTEELSFLKMKRDAKLTCFFQNWRKQFDKFWHEHSKVSNIFILIGSLWEKYISIELKKYRRVIFHETEEGFKIWKEIHLSFQNWHKEFDKFWPEHSKSQEFSL